VDTGSVDDLPCLEQSGVTSEQIT